MKAQNAPLHSSRMEPCSKGMMHFQGGLGRVHKCMDHAFDCIRGRIMGTVKKDRRVSQSEHIMEQMPIRIRFLGEDSSPAFCDEAVSILYACIGTARIEDGRKTEILKEDDVFLISRMKPVRIEEIRGTLLLVRIDSVYFDQFEEGFSSLRFRSSAGEAADAALKHLLASILHSMESGRTEARMEIEQMLMSAAILLQREYASEDADSSFSQDAYIRGTAAYVHAHLTERIKLSGLAESIGLSEQYLSHLFTRLAGMSLSDYIVQERLNESLRTLRYGHQNISEIALSCGFPNVKSYYASFRRHFGMTPSAYRKEYQSGSASPIGIGRAEALRHLYVHLAEGSADQLPPLPPREYEADLNHAEGKLRRSWQRTLGFSNAYTAMGEEMRNQLRLIQKEMPFRYIRFHGIFSDDMKIIRRDEQGRIWYDFSRCDQLIDFFLSIGLKPYAELGYMPSELASRPDYTFAWRANVSMPADISAWKALVKAWLENVISRYGRREVRTWYFEIWNSFGFPFSTTLYSEEEKLSFLKETWRTVKAVDPHLRTGVIDTYLILADYNHYSMLQEDFRYFRKNHIHPDFLSFSLYTTIFREMDYQKIRENTQLKDNGVFSPQRVFTAANETVYAERDFTQRRLESLRAWLQENTDFDGELILNEWNLTPDSRDKLNDTAFKAPFFISNALQCRDQADAMIYWTFSDIFEEVDYREEGQPFHGGIGFLTNSGLKKPVWHALQFLSRLGDTVLMELEDAIVTRSADGSVQILLWNYCDFGSRERTADYGEKGDRYAVFDARQKHIILHLSSIFGRFEKTVYVMNRENGSVYDQWEKMGAPADTAGETGGYLAAASMCGYHASSAVCSGSFTEDRVLEPHEIALILLKPAP